MKWIKIVFYFFIAIVREVAVYIFIVPLGIAYYFFRLKQKDRAVVVLCNHIGDIVFTLAAVEQLNKKYQKTTLFLEKRWLKMLQAFEVEADVRKISPFWRWVVFRSNKTEVGQRILYYSKQVKIINTGDYFTLGYEAPRRIQGCTLIDCIHRVALGFDQTYEIRLKRKRLIMETDMEVFAVQNGIIKGRTVILTPVAYSVSRLNDDFYEWLAQRFKEYGYKVFTNISSQKEVEIKGTQRLVCGLDQIVEIAEYCGYLIGVRNGLMDLISLSTCQIIALYHMEDPMYDFYDIRKNKKENNGKLYQYQVTGDDVHDIETIVQLCIKGE